MTLQFFFTHIIVQVFPKYIYVKCLYLYILKMGKLSLSFYKLQNSYSILNIYTHFKEISLRIWSHF